MNAVKNNHGIILSILKVFERIGQPATVILVSAVVYGLIYAAIKLVC